MLSVEEIDEMLLDIDSKQHLTQVINSTQTEISSLALRFKDPDSAANFYIAELHKKFNNMNVTHEQKIEFIEELKLAYMIFNRAIDINAFDICFESKNIDYAKAYMKHFLTKLSS